jgi:hypothetical protein
MTMNKINMFHIGLVLILGLAVGWFLGSWSLDSEDDAPITKPTEILDTAVIASIAESVQATDIPVSVAESSNEMPIETEQWYIDELIEAIHQWKVGDVYRDRPLVMSLVSDPELMYELLDQYLDIANEDAIRIARYLLRTSRGVEGAAEIDTEILYRMRNGNRSQEWLHALKSLGAYDTELIQYLSDELPLFYETQDVASAINALSFLGPNWKSDDYSHDLTKKITQQISEHINSTDPAIRNAAIMSLDKYPQNDISSILLDAISDPSDSVRKAALEVLSNNDLPSTDEIKPSLLAIMNNEGESYGIRQLASLALHGVTLYGDELEQYVKFLQQHKDRK